MMNHLPAHDDEPLSYHKILSLSVDAFLWISVELDRICKALFAKSEDPDSITIRNIADELSLIVDESKAFATQSQEDLATLEEEAGNNEQDHINSQDG
jgi:hypothetical protein